jgi:hypothetical protein
VFVAESHDPNDLTAHFLEANSQRRKRVPCRVLIGSKQAQQKVLCADVVVLERTRLVLREDDDLPSRLRKALEHDSSP